MNEITILGVKLEIGAKIQINRGESVFKVLEISETVVKLLPPDRRQLMWYLDRKSAKCTTCPWYVGRTTVTHIEKVGG